MIGNYEFYYAAGLLKKVYQLDINEDMKPQELFDAIMAKRSALETSDEKVEYLLHMIDNYETMEDYDDQMKELFLMGVNEGHMWQVQIS